MSLSIRDSIALLFQQEMAKEEPYVKIGRAVNVNTENDTFTFIPNDESSQVEEVILKAIATSAGGSIVIVPKEGSFVSVAFMSQTTGVLIHAEEAETLFIDADQTIINGGENGGLINIEELTDRLNDLTDTVNDLIQAFRSHTHGGVETGGGITQQTTEVVQNADAFNSNDYEDPLVTH